MACLCLPGLAATLAAQSVSEVQVTPETMTLAVGQKQPIFATAYDRQGNLIAAAKFTFWSSDTAIAKVSRDGIGAGYRGGIGQDRGPHPGTEGLARRTRSPGRPTEPVAAPDRC